MRKIWVIEIKFADSVCSSVCRNFPFYDNWYSTVGVALNRADGRKILKEWRARNPTNKFQLVQYRQF